MTVVSFSLLRIILGDFNVGLMHDTNRVLGPVFFFLFIFFICFVLLSLFLAIINQAYLTVKDMADMYGVSQTLITYIFGVCVDVTFNK